MCITNKLCATEASHLGSSCVLTRHEPTCLGFRSSLVTISRDTDGLDRGSEPIGKLLPPPVSAGGWYWRPPRHQPQQTDGPSACSSWTVRCGIQTPSHNFPQSCKVWSDLGSRTPGRCSPLQTASYLWWNKVNKFVINQAPKINS